MDIKGGELIGKMPLETQKRLMEHIADLETKYIALLAKLDADGGVTDTNYATLLTPTDRIVL